MIRVSPYIRLMRLDKPTGILLLLWPCLWSIGLASGASFSESFIAHSILFTIGAIIMRSAGCVINDIIDKDIDKKVKRTKTRPLASGELKIQQAFILLGFLLLSGLYILLLLNGLTIILGLIIVFFVVAYPYMKRFTYWPQLFLGLTFNIGAVMGWSAVTNDIALPALLLYTGGIFWTLGYDTIYAHQDKKDDKKAKVKSTAIWFGKDTKIYLSVFYTLSAFFLFIAGLTSGDSHPMFYIALVLGLLQLFWQVNNVKLNKPADCMEKFKSNTWFGLIIFSGIILDKLCSNLYN